MTANKQAREKKFQEQDKKIGVSYAPNESLGDRAIHTFNSLSNLFIWGLFGLVLLYLWACYQTNTPVLTQFPVVLLTCFGFVKFANGVIDLAEKRKK